MPLPTPQIGIGTPPTWYDAEPAPATVRPELGQEPRPLMPGDIRYEYWETRFGVRGKPSESAWVRLLIHNAASAPPEGAIPISPGDHDTYVRIKDLPEIETVKTQRLVVRR